MIIIDTYIGSKHEYHVGDINNIVQIKDIFRDENSRRLEVLVRCVLCGREKIIHASSFATGNSTSCKCQSIKHGLSKTKLYGVYHNMKDRCYNSRQHEYYNYGGKGVRICDEWLESFLNFKQWADTHGYKEGLTIDRIDSNGNYEPDNCQWITKSENTIKANKTCQHRMADKGKYYGISPDGEYYEFENASQFAREHDLYAGCVRAVANGTKKTHKKWRFGFIVEQN